MFKKLAGDIRKHHRLKLYSLIHYVFNHYQIITNPDFEENLHTDKHRHPL